MTNNQNIIFPKNKAWIEKLAEEGVFEREITGWITECNLGVKTRQDILNVTKKVAQYRNTPTLLEEIRQRIS